jgi:hypothetical protein
MMSNLGGPNETALTKPLSEEEWVKKVPDIAANMHRFAEFTQPWDWEQTLASLTKGLPDWVVQEATKKFTEQREEAKNRNLKIRCVTLNYKDHSDPWPSEDSIVWPGMILRQVSAGIDPGFEVLEVLHVDREPLRQEAQCVVMGRLVPSEVAKFERSAALNEARKAHPERQRLEGEIGKLQAQVQAIDREIEEEYDRKL